VRVTGDLSIGDSEAFRAFSRDLSRVAASEVTVLIEGENGSGKTSGARAVHALGRRAAGPLVEVDLAALSPSLLESELFGHEEGAFTGAHRARLGRFRRAEGGTLVLDGIECLPYDLQVKLLRTLQERVVEPLGGEEAIPIDVRVVATSGRDLRATVDAGEFREDLYYRLAVVTLQVPPLRARIPDIPELVERLAGEVAARAGVPVRVFGADALARLSEHTWPGNVRELENAVERVMVLAPDDADEVRSEELEFLSESVVDAPRRLAREALSHGVSLGTLTSAMMEEALREERGNLSAAARRVGLSRRAFEYRRAKLAETQSDDVQDVPDEGERDDR
jgi:DNA-binding NtrC family response regulator